MYDKIVGIIGPPRSGTSWTGQIFDSAPGVLYRMQPFYSYAFRDKIHVRSTEAEINAFFRELYESKDAYLSQEVRRNTGVYPVFSCKEEHPSCMVFKEVMFHYMMPVIMKNVPELFLLAIVRNPVDVLTSYYNAPREFDPALDIQKEWYFARSRNEMLPERYFGYFKWKEYLSIIDYLQTTYPDRVNIARYEDFSEEPLPYVTKWFQEYNIELTGQTLDFLSASQQITGEDPYSVFRDKSHRPFRKELPENIITEIKQDLQKFELAQKYGYR